MARTLAVLTFLALVTTSASAQAQAPDRFPTMDACKAAFRTGNYTVYVPTNRSGYGKNPVNNRTIIRSPLTQDGCVHELTAGGWHYVVRLKGTQYRWEVPTVGPRKILAEDECGNDADQVVYLPTPTSMAPAAVTRGEPGLQGLPCDPALDPLCRGPEGNPGENGKNGSVRPGVIAGVVAGIVTGIVAWRLLSRSDHNDASAAPALCMDKTALNFGQTGPCKPDPNGVHSDSSIVKCTSTVAGVCPGTNLIPVSGTKFALSPVVTENKTGLALNKSTYGAMIVQDKKVHGWSFAISHSF